MDSSATAAPRALRPVPRRKTILKLFLALVLQGLVAASVAAAAGPGTINELHDMGVLAPAAASVDERQGSRPYFRFGGPCEDLAAMSSEQLRGLTISSNARQFHSFCFLLRGEECSDFAPFFVDLGGVFEASEWADYCRFIPVGRLTSPGRPNDVVDPCRMGLGNDNSHGSYDCG